MGKVDGNMCNSSNYAKFRINTSFFPVIKKVIMSEGQSCGVFKKFPTAPITMTFVYILHPTNVQGKVISSLNSSHMPSLTKSRHNNWIQQKVCNTQDSFKPAYTYPLCTFHIQDYTTTLQLLV